MVPEAWSRAGSAMPWELRARARGGLLLVGDDERMYSLTLCGEPCAPAPTAFSLLCTTGMRTRMPDHGKLVTDDMSRRWSVFDICSSERSDTKGHKESRSATSS